MNLEAHMIEEATAARWVPALLIPGSDLEPGISQSFAERQPGNYATAAEAMDAALALLKGHPKAIGATALRKS
jgi:hypothetical protein